MISGEMSFLKAQPTALLARWGMSSHSNFPSFLWIVLLYRTVWAEKRRARRVKSLSANLISGNSLSPPVAFLGWSARSP